MAKPADTTHGASGRPGSRRGIQIDQINVSGATVGDKDHGDVPHDDDSGELRYPKNGIGLTDPAG